MMSLQNSDFVWLPPLAPSCHFFPSSPHAQWCGDVVQPLEEADLHVSGPWGWWWVSGARRFLWGMCQCVLLLPATPCRQISVWFAVLQVQVKDSAQGANSSFTSKQSTKSSPCGSFLVAHWATRRKTLLIDSKQPLGSQLQDMGCVSILLLRAAVGLRTENLVTHKKGPGGTESCHYPLC